MNTTVTTNDQKLYVIASLENKLFSFPTDYVETMVTLPSVSKIPNVPMHVRGVINIRGKVIPLIDLRLRLGMPSLREDTEALLSMLSKREAEHINWVEELLSSVQENREFNLQTNPHLCAFGKWYYGFKTDNLLLSMLLKKFDEPHQRIHGIASKVISLEKANNRDAALKLIEETKTGDLAEMIRLFKLLQSEYRESVCEIAVVMTINNSTFAVAVDTIETVSRITITDTDAVENLGIRSTEKGIIAFIGNLEKAGKFVVGLDVKELFRNESNIELINS